jgi:hypothetical protein
MNRKLLLFAIAVLAMLFLLLVPLVPVTVTITVTCPANSLCMRIPAHATELPNGQYSFVMFESITYWLFHSGGFLNGNGFYIVSFPNTSTMFVGLLFDVLPLCVIDGVLFVLAFATGKRRKVPLQKVDGIA